MNLHCLSVEELQRLGRAGDSSAVAELGRRALDMDFCFGDEVYCEHRHELSDLQQALNSEPPPECPHCGGWLTEV